MRIRAPGLLHLLFSLSLISGCSGGSSPPSSSPSTLPAGGARAAPGSSGEAHARQASELLLAGRVDDSQREIDAALRLKPDEPSYQVIAGRIQIAQGDVVRARAFYDRAAGLAPQKAGRIYADLASALAEANSEAWSRQIESALQAAASAVPPDLDSLFHLGQSYASAGRDEGRTFLERYLRESEKLPADQQDAQRIRLARQMIRALDALRG